MCRTRSCKPDLPCDLLSVLRADPTKKHWIAAAHVDALSSDDAAGASLNYNNSAGHPIVFEDDGVPSSIEGLPGTIDVASLNTT
jgi:hypothetical protein